MYFNIGRIVYLQTDAIFSYILLAPTIVAGKITLGTMNQIIRAFGQVRTSFQYLINVLEHDRRTDFDLQAVAGFRGHHRGRAAAIDRDPDGAGVGAVSAAG